MKHIGQLRTVPESDRDKTNTTSQDSNCGKGKRTWQTSFLKDEIFVFVIGVRVI
jgi:hypothetical protein